MARRIGILPPAPRPARGGGAIARPHRLLGSAWALSILALLDGCALPSFEKVDDAPKGASATGSGAGVGSGSGSGSGSGAGAGAGSGGAGSGSGSGAGSGLGQSGSSGSNGAGSGSGSGSGGGAEDCQSVEPPDGGSPCGAHPGPAMIAVPAEGGGSYCIDATEVTNAHYAEFLATMPEVASQDSFCQWNESLSPKGWKWPNPGKEALPATGVDWCDAWAYCAWAGKRLCGKVGGGHGPYDLSRADPILEQWYRACSAGGEKPFPYGGEYDAKACNGAGYGADGPIAVGTATQCVGGFGCAYDLAGNVREWVDQCDGYKNELDACFALGGSYDQTGNAVSCLSLTDIQRDVAGPHIGFRCCSDP